MGPFVDRFEQELAARVGAQYAVATVSGTAALHIALLVAGIQPDDEVLVSGLTFIAPASAIRYVGAYPVFIDAEPEFLQMDAEKAKAFLEEECDWRRGELRNKTTKRRVKAILPVHILGHPVDMDPLLRVARKFGLAVIEDATESLGATYKGRMVGHLGDVGCFSFNGNKIITTGGGGMIVTDNPVWAKEARYLVTQAKDDPVEYVHNRIGYNYRLANVLAAIGVAQLEQLATYVAAKRDHAQYYSELLREVPGVQAPKQASWAHSTFWLYCVSIDECVYGVSSRQLMLNLKHSGIQSRPLWRPLHTLPPFRDCQAFEVQVADRLHASCLCLPSSVGLTAAEQHRVHEVVISHHSPLRAAGQ
jgi:perosamine synthetase